jgi:hypothetical protein
MVFKKLVSLRETRVKRLVDEAKAAEKDAKDTERNNIRKSILQK